MLIVYLARHSETLWNTQNRMQGRQDSPLTGNGIRQCRSLGLLLESIPLEQAWTSPAPRALATGEIALAGHPSCSIPQTDSRLHEMSLGTWEGWTLDEARQSDPDNLHAFLHKPDLYRPSGGGETYAELCIRTRSFLDDLLQWAVARRAHLPSQVCHCLVISHSITLRALFTQIRGRPAATLREGPPPEQAVLYKADWQGRWHTAASDTSNGNLPADSSTQIRPVIQ